MKKRVVVIDDSPFIRRLISDWLNHSDDFDVVGVGVNGQEGAAMVADLKPDLVTLDVEMPILDGLGCLRLIQQKCPTRVVMVSSVTAQGTAATMEALELGAIDFFTKPNGASSIQFAACKDDLLAKLRAAASARLQFGNRPAATSSRPAAPVAPKWTTDKVVVLASSTGGPKALTTFFSQIEPGFGAPILVAQHMPTGFTATLAQRLSQCGPMAVREAANGDLVRPGEALICPGGQHMFYLPDGRVRIEDGPALHGVKPAADHLFLSAARCLGSRTVGVVLTGMGRDGADGSVAVRKAGGVVFGECEESCTVYGMPRAAKQAGGIDEEFPVEQIPARLLKAVMREARRAS